MLQNFTGWHVLILLVVVLIPALVIVLLVLFLVRRSQRTSAQTPNAGAPVTAALEDLELARARGHISEAEYESKRAEILRRL